MHCRKRKKNSYRNILHQLKKISKISKISKTELHLENNVRKMWNFVMFFKNQTFFVSIDIIATFWCFKPIPLLLSKRKLWTFEMTKSVLSGRRAVRLATCLSTSGDEGHDWGTALERSFSIGLPTYFISKPKKIPLPYIVKHANKFKLKKFDSHLIYIIFGQSTYSHANRENIS